MMRNLGIVFICCLMNISLWGFSFGSDSKKANLWGFSFGSDSKKANFENLDMRKKGGSLYIRHHDNKSLEVVITDSYDLIVSGRRLSLNRYQKSLARQYVEEYDDLVVKGKAIGLEGGKIGAQGAAIGLKAIARLPRMLRSDYDSEDYEKEIEAMVGEIEGDVKNIERKAKKLERQVERFEELHIRFKNEVPALRYLDWF
jgi:hypothetical protein